MFDLYDDFVLVTADNASDNIVSFVGLVISIQWLINGLGTGSQPYNPMYTRTTLLKYEILDNYKSVLAPFRKRREDEYDKEV